MGLSLTAWHWFICLGLAPPGDGLSFETPTGWERRVDAARKTTLFVPTGLLPGRECALVVFPPEEYSGTAQALQERLVALASQGGEIQGKVQAGTIGSFAFSSFVWKTPRGGLQWVAVHSAQWGDRMQAVLYVADGADLFFPRGKEVAGMLGKVAVPGPPTPAPLGTSAAAVDPASTAIAGLLIPLPPGWKVEKGDAGWTVVSPPADLDVEKTQVFVLPSQRLEGTHWGAHKALLSQILRTLKWEEAKIEPSTLAAPGPFIASEASWRLSVAAVRKIRLYTAAAGDRMEAVVVIPGWGESFIRALIAVLERTTLKDAPPPKRPEVAEAYRVPNQKKFLNIDGSISTGRVMYERMFLYSNGVADFSSSYVEGLGGSAFVPKVDPGLLNGFYGSWKAEGQSVRILREEGAAEEVYEREGGNLRRGDQVWRPVPRVDGLHLKGRYAYKSAPGGPAAYNYWIDFTEEGTFRTGGALSWLSSTDVSGRPRPPETASGTYEIRDWTVWFRLESGQVWSTDFMTFMDDPRDLSTVLLDAFAFHRE